MRKGCQRISIHSLVLRVVKPCSHWFVGPSKTPSPETARVRVRHNSVMRVSIWSPTTRSPGRFRAASSGENTGGNCGGRNRCHSPALPCRPLTSSQGIPAPLTSSNSRRMNVRPPASTSTSACATSRHGWPQKKPVMPLVNRGNTVELTPSAPGVARWLAHPARRTNPSAAP